MRSRIMTFGDVDPITKARIIQLQGELHDDEGILKSRSYALKVAMEKYYGEDE